MRHSDELMLGLLDKVGSLARKLRTKANSSNPELVVDAATVIGRAMDMIRIRLVCDNVCNSNDVESVLTVLEQLSEARVAVGLVPVDSAWAREQCMEIVRAVEAEESDWDDTGQ